MSNFHGHRAGKRESRGLKLSLPRDGCRVPVIQGRGPDSRRRRSFGLPLYRPLSDQRRDRYCTVAAAASFITIEARQAGWISSLVHKR